MKTLTERPARNARTTVDVERLAYSMPQAADVIGVSRSTMYALIARGLVRFVRLPGGSIRVPRSALTEYLDGQK